MCVTPALKRALPIFLLIFCCLSVLAVAAVEPSPAPEAAEVKVWNRVITVLRSRILSVSPSERATRIEDRLMALPVTGPWDLSTYQGAVGGVTGIYVVANGQVMLGLAPGDADLEAGVTLQEEATRVVTRLREFLDAREKQLSPGLLLRGAIKSLLATILLVVLIVAVGRLRRRLWEKLDRGEIKIANRLHVGDVEVWPFLATILKGLVKILRWVVILSAVYVWFGYVCRHFPYTRPWAEELGANLLDAAQRVGDAFVEAMPGLFMVLVICVITRFLAGLASAFFRNVERGFVKSDWLRPDTARATRRIVVVLMWAFALTVAYPYIPGSGSAAFKGVSVFIGLMFSLGSAGMINQIISGLVVVYSRSFQTGDFVRVGETEGVVTQVGLLSTRITTGRQEEITVPNALLISNPAWNFSSFNSGLGACLSTAVTIGYDAPWRQVHALLLEAAGKTPGIKQHPEPFVLQRALSDFYVEYHLLTHLENPQRRAAAQSLLHTAIQDAFNKYGVQIMSPNFEAQPEKQVMVPREKWFESPAQPEGSRPQQDEADRGR